MAFEDTFSRADANTLGSPWVHLDGNSLGSAFGIASNEARYLGPMDTAPIWGGSGSNYYSTQLATVDVGSADMAVEWNVEGPATGGALYLPFRYAAGTSPTWLNNSLHLGTTSASANRLYLFAPSAGVVGPMVDVPGWRTGDTIRVEAVGTAIKVYVGGTLVMTRSTSECLSNTRAGIGGTATTNYTDNGAAYHSGSGEGAATVDAGTALQTCEWEWSALPSRGPTYHVFRYQDANNYWIVSGTGSSTSTIYLYQNTGGAWFQRGPTGTGTIWAPGDTLRVEAAASSITVKINGATKISYSTTAPASGHTRAGIGGNMSDATLKGAVWSKFTVNSFTDAFVRPYANTLGTPWVSHAGTWGTGTKPWSWTTHDRLEELDYARWTRFYCSPWPLNRGFRNLGLTRGARSVT
jgi:hypothetical protein